jgi:predicted nuclease of predicted toxin-antitoxin system
MKSNSLPTNPFQRCSRSDNVSIWEFCRREGFVVVSKDNDFGLLAMQRGTPPKAICIRLGNCTTQDVETRSDETLPRFDHSGKILKPPC